MNISDVLTELHKGFRTYENRGHLKTRLDLLESNIMYLRNYERVVTAGEKEKLAEYYEQIAFHCLKGAILTEINLQKIERKQSQSLKMA